MGEDEIEFHFESYAQAAEAAKSFGADAIEMHCAHETLGYTFLSPVTNRRTDRWGGGPQERIRFVVETMRRIRQRVGDGLALGIRISGKEFRQGGYDNLERLDHLRKVMFAGPESFGATKMTLEHQGKPGEKLAENTRFVHEGIVFVGLNVPGSNNNKVGDKDCAAKSARTPAQCAADNAEYAERDAANIAWMHEAFELARQQKAAGIVLVLQADPWFDLPETEGVDERQAPGADGYTNFLAKLVEETRAFPGQVLFVHGDTHFFKLDKPLIRQDQLLENFTRLETFGSPNVHWVKVTVDPTARGVFVVQPMLVAGN